MKIYDVVVVGAGPAGITAAITAAKNGKSIVLVEKNEQVGRKILATGNGRCNVTNKNATVDHYHGSDEIFISKVLKKYDQHKLIKFFETQGVVLKEEDRGRMFPRTNQAATIVSALQHVLESKDIVIKTSCEVKSIRKKDLWEIDLGGGTIYSKSLILATGGRAAHQFGSSGDGLYWAQRLGHTLVPTYAALVPLETKEEWVKDVQGTKVEANVMTKYDGNIIKETQGDVLFTHYGLSGPAIMSQSRDIAHLVETGKVQMVLDLYPDITEKEFEQKLENLFKTNNKKAVKNSLAGILPAGLTSIIVRLSELEDDKNVSQVSKKERMNIVRNIKSLNLTVKKIRPLKEAQVTRGGVSTKEVDDSTLESKIVPTLYFAGEILDVDADSGGYNLQWAWSSGHVAGSSI